MLNHLFWEEQVVRLCSCCLTICIKKIKSKGILQCPRLIKRILVFHFCSCYEGLSPLFHYHLLWLYLYFSFLPPSLSSFHLFLSLFPLKFKATKGGVSIDSTPNGFPPTSHFLYSFPKDNNINNKRGQH